MTFPERLIKLRTENGYPTRISFAEKMEIPVTTLKHYEDGDREPGHTFLKKVSELFDVSIDYLLGLTDEKEVLHSFRITSKEQGMIEKYRHLDTYGSELVDIVLDKEFERCKEEDSDKVLKFSVERETGKIVARNGSEITEAAKQEIKNLLS